MALAPAAGLKAHTPTLRVHPAIRIRHWHGSAATWLLENVEKRRRFKISKTVVLAVLAHADAPSTNKAYARVAAHISIRPDQWKELCEQLAELGVLVSSDFVNSHPMGEALAVWRGSWQRAADYIWVTYDYPFLDYADGRARLADQERMAEYVREVADSDRTKSYRRDGIPEVSCPPPKTVLTALNAPFDVAVHRTAPSMELNGVGLRSLMSVTFGRLRNRRLRMAGREPQIRRTSPSGGSRHPTEGYVSARGITDLPDGLYHYSTTEYCMMRIADPLSPALFGFAEPMGKHAFVVTTSVFERNMYRYREPKTFRTIHLDAGHIIGTIEVTAQSLGLSAERLYLPDYSAIDDALQIKTLVEGTICGALIRGRK